MRRRQTLSGRGDALGKDGSGRPHRRLTVADLRRLSVGSPSNYVLAPPRSVASDIVDGAIAVEKCRSGILVHTTATTELADGEIETQLPAGIRFGVVLEGALRFRVGAEPVDVAAGSDDSFFIALSAADTLRRTLNRGAFVRKAIVAVDDAWLRARFGDELESLPPMPRETNAAVTRWRSSSALKQIAADLAGHEEYDGALRDLYLESKALEFLARCMLELSQAVPPVSAAVASDARDERDGQSARRIRRRVDERLAANEIVDLAELAKSLGMSASKLQRKFKRYFGETVFGYVRRNRLEFARNALASRHVSVAEAAYLSGYNHTSNFSAAFKRAFGVAPRTWRDSH